MKGFFRLFHTVKYLKFTQVYFRLFYLIRAKFRKTVGFKYSFSKSAQNSQKLFLLKSISSNSKFSNNKFSFLNLSKKFENNIEWNYDGYGKLWTYNLCYFEYLKEKEDIKLIYDFINSIEDVKDGIEPFPISLRGISWIKFLTQHNIKDEKIDDSLYAQYYILLDNLEYHLLGNHLLENGFSLLFGSYYFKDEILYKKAEEILSKELEEQVLGDGAHFELSPMYHQIMLFRILDCINLIQNNNWKNDLLIKTLKNKASLMLGWLNNITYDCGNIPLLNDSANLIAPSSNELFEYANTLDLNIEFVKLKDSGYRVVKKDNFELVVDVGEIGPSYIPGHAHADTLNFELYIENKPFIVDSGLSTYNIGNKRDFERSTSAHNTVEINNSNSSNVWGGFRVAQRANIMKLEENNTLIKASHDGYQKKYGVIHSRYWNIQDDKIIIEDNLNLECEAISRIHFHPSATKEEINKRIKTSHTVKINTYEYAPEFNKTFEAFVVEISFKKELKVEINI